MLYKSIYKAIVYFLIVIKLNKTETSIFKMVRVFLFNLFSQISVTLYDFFFIFSPSLNYYQSKSKISSFYRPKINEK